MVILNDNRLVFAVQGGYFFLMFFMISFTAVKAPFRKGAETAATVSLLEHYIRQSAYLQDNQQNKKNAMQGHFFALAVRVIAFERIF